MASAIIVAAGSGLRMNNTVRKQYLDLGGYPVLTRTILAFDTHPDITGIFLVIAESDREYCRDNILPRVSTNTIRMVIGGAERTDSVFQGILSAENADGILLIHDGVRPFVTGEMISSVIAGAADTGACIVGIPAVDTLKEVDAGQVVKKTVPRTSIWQAQTPQAFDYQLIRNAYEYAIESGIRATDDAAIVEHFGHPVRMISGNPFNIKITTPADLEFARALTRINAV